MPTYKVRVARIDTRYADIEVTCREEDITEAAAEALPTAQWSSPDTETDICHYSPVPALIYAYGESSAGELRHHRVAIQVDTIREFLMLEGAHEVDEFLSRRLSSSGALAVRMFAYEDHDALFILEQILAGQKKEITFDDLAFGYALTPQGAIEALSPPDAGAPFEPAEK